MVDPLIGGTNQDQSPGVSRPCCSSRCRCVMNWSAALWWSTIRTPSARNECSTATFSSSSALSRHRLVELRVDRPRPVSYTHLRAHETVLDLVCRLLLEK